ncbi:MAG: hypothetical protein PHD15_07245 [Clostridia bacterium]|nr:hypothetical protein [Clostridia bacterium]
MKKIFLTISIFLLTIIASHLYKNGFFKTNHIDTMYGKNIELRVPLFSYYNGNGGMIVYRFKTFLPKKVLEKEKDLYLSTLEHICNNSFYDENQNITIFSYNIENSKLFFKNIYIGVEDGKYCN